MKHNSTHGSERRRRGLLARLFAAFGLVAVFAAGFAGLSATSASAAQVSLSANHVLYGGQSISSADGHFQLWMQTDGNVVLYQEGRVRWATGTAGHPGAWLAMQGDGNLVVYRGNLPPSPGNALWSSGTWAPNGASAYLTVQTDGNAVIYLSSSALWSTRTGGSGCGTFSKSFGMGSASGAFTAAMCWDGRTAWSFRPTTCSVNYSFPYPWGHITWCGVAANGSALTYAGVDFKLNPFYDPMWDQITCVNRLRIDATGHSYVHSNDSWCR